MNFPGCQSNIICSPCFLEKGASSAKGNAKADRRAMMGWFRKKKASPGAKGALLVNRKKIANRSKVFVGTGRVLTSDY